MLVHKWVPVNLLLGVIMRWTSIPPNREGVEILPVVFMLQKPGNKGRPVEALGSNADLTFTYRIVI